MRKVLSSKFFNQPALKVARNLLGKFLIRRIGNKEIAVMITEVEAYDGFDDKASHARSGKTERNKIMFEKGGIFYVYFTYGMHYMLNIVTGPKNYPAAILIRGGVLLISNKRSITNNWRELLVVGHKSIIDGPAKLTKYFKIDKKFNGLKANKKTGLWIEDRGVKIKKLKIRKSKRIGVDYAGKWADKPYRFLIEA